MFSSKIKKIALVAALAATFSLTACLQGEDDTQDAPTTKFRVNASISAVNGTGTLAKGSTIQLSKVIVVLTAGVGSPTAADTVRDTIKAGVSQGFTSNSAVNQTIDSVYSLRALRHWKVVVTVLDINNQVTHKDSITPSGLNFVRIGDMTTVTFGTLAPKFTMYRAIFDTLPDSVTTTATTNKQAVRFTRLVVRIDGAIVRDSLRAGFFNGLPRDTVEYDYVTPGLHTIRLAAYGQLLNQAGTALITDTLFVGQDTVTTVAGVDGGRTFTLNWTNPANNKGTESITVTIGKVGRTTVTGSMTGIGVVPKSKNKE